MISIEQKVRQSTTRGNGTAVTDVSAILRRGLDHAERIVRNAVNWQDQNGRIIDPYEQKETNTVTARFLGALGLQIQHGRCLDLIPSCAAALTPALEDLFHKRARDWGEFIVKEAFMAYIALKGKVPRAQYDQWTHLLADYDPETTYGHTWTNTPDPAAMHNYVTFGIAGEALKKKFGLADHTAFMDKYIAQQLDRCDENGMYNDPHSPLVYDVTPRMNLSIAMWAGYDGTQHENLSETLKRGGLSQLLYQSSTGEFPFGGRSNQQNFVEVSFAIVCLFEARRWAGMGDMLMAGAFMRAAGLALRAIEKYLRHSPIYFNKNLFPPETQHGRQRSYGFYGAYSLLIASQIGFASLMADETIASMACPAERGGYVFIPTASFHKIFANCGGTHLEIDTNADFKYDATGLGRVHFRGCPAELCLSSPITATPGYLTCVPPAPENIVIGPGRQGHWLAGWNGEQLRTTVRVTAATPERVAFSVEYEHAGDVICESYELLPGALNLQIDQQTDLPLEFRMPLLKTDGAEIAETTALAHGFEVVYRGCVCKIECLTPDTNIRLEEFEAPNRNGIYNVARFSTAGRRLQFHISARQLRPVQQA